MDNFKGWRTIIFNVVAAIAAIAVIFGLEIDAETQTKIVEGLVALLTVGNLVLRKFTDTPVGKKQAGFVDVRLLVVLAFSLVLMACGAGTVFKPKTDSCDSYKDPVYQSFCKADLIIEAARAEVNRQRALSTTDARAIELNGWEAKVKRADADLAHVEKVYRSTGVLLDAENAAVGVLVNQLEGWALK